jgi:hypothetical protein
VIRAEQVGHWRPDEALVIDLVEDADGRQCAEQAVQAASMGADARRDLVGGYRLIADEIREPELGGHVDGLRDPVPVHQPHQGSRGRLDWLGHRVYLRG